MQNHCFFLLKMQEGTMLNNVCRFQIHFHTNAVHRLKPLMVRVRQRLRRPAENGTQPRCCC